MADRPLSNPLPADLPEDWTSGQIVAPSGADVGLSQQHGYNYLMAQVNAVQQAVNAINESFDTISGKRTCRVTIGTSTAGWTQADCDYLCDGMDDQEELNAAVAAVNAQGGGEIAVLGGEYFLTAAVTISSSGGSLSITGEPGATVFNLSGNITLSSTNSAGAFRFFGITFQPAAPSGYQWIIAQTGAFVFDGCIFHNVGISDNYSGDSTVSFVFQNNYIEIGEGAEGGSALNVTVGHSGRILISHNIFTLAELENSGFDLIYLYGNTNADSDVSNIVFTGNSVMAVGANRPAVTLGDGVLSVGNSFSGCAVKQFGGSFFANSVENGDVKSSIRSIVSQNRVLSGTIGVSDNTIVSGNYVTAVDGQPAISIIKNDNLAQADIAPSVVGNYITGGSIGIYLKKLDWMTNPGMSNALVSGNRIWGCETPIQIDDNWSRCMVTGNIFPAGDSIVDNGTDNIVRLNSDDSGGSGGVAGVSSFKGRTGAVVPQFGDYTAAQVGAIASGAVQTVQVLTQAEYDALSTKNASTLYLIKE